MPHSKPITVDVPRETFQEAFASLSEEERRALAGHGYGRNKGNPRAEYLLRCALVQIARDSGESVPQGHEVVPTKYGEIEVVNPDDSDDSDGFFDFV